MHLSEEQMMYNRFGEMLDAAYRRGIPVFGDFVGMNGQSVMHRLLDDRGILGNMADAYVSFYGGYPQAERQMICFLPGMGAEAEDEDFPISCVKIEPSGRKFCEKLGHRDFLGAVMNIGIERSQIGDVVVKEEDDGKNAAYVGYVFCKKDKKPLLCEITRVRNTAVLAKEVDGSGVSFLREYKEIHASVASLRLDAVAAAAMKSSRSDVESLIGEGRVYLNGRQCAKNSQSVNDGDVMTIRGHGKFLIEASRELTKKGRCHITVKQYI